MKRPGPGFPAWMPAAVLLLSFALLAGGLPDAAYAAAAEADAGGLPKAVSAGKAGAGGLPKAVSAGKVGAGGLPDTATTDAEGSLKAAADEAGAPANGGAIKPAEDDPPAEPPATDNSPNGLQLTGYRVIKGDADPYTGRIVKDNNIAVILSVIDDRITSGSAKPAAVLNTASFTIPNQRNIKYGNPKISTKGCAYTITITNLQYLGIGNSLDLSVYYSNLSLPVQTLSLALNQCVEYVPPEPVEPPAEPDVVVKGTGFVLRDARYGDGVIYAGQSFTLSAEILATNGTAAVENVSVMFSPAEELTLAGGSSVVYIGAMAPGASAPVSVSLLPGANIQEGSYIVSIEVSGVNQKTGDQVSAQMTVSVPVLQPERFEIFETMLPTDLMAGVDNGMGYGSVTLVNMGKGAVSNVTVEIFGDGLSAEEGRQYLGNVGGGEQKAADFNIQADMAGRVKALVVVCYENARGESKTLEHAFTIDVMEMEEPVFDDPGLEFPGEGTGGGLRTGPPPWLWIAIAACVACVLAAVLVRRRKKRLAAKEAELDEVDYGFESGEDDEDAAKADDD